MNFVKVKIEPGVCAPTDHNQSPNPNPNENQNQNQILNRYQNVHPNQNLAMKAVREEEKKVTAKQPPLSVIKKEPGVNHGNVAVKLEPDSNVASRTMSRELETAGDMEDKKATQVEVLALRTQVAYLQDTIEDLRKQLDCVLTVLDDSKSSSLENAQGKKKGGKKQQLAKVSKIGMKRPRSFGALPFAKNTVDTEVSSGLGKAGNSLNLSATELRQVCEILENEESANASEDSVRHDKDDEKNEVIRSISEATQLDRDSVCKIIKYFSELTTKEQNEGKVSALDKIEVTLQAQKVGAN